jgi:oligosaccharyltransferase complex subunit alpha (ribophorin I)
MKEPSLMAIHRFFVVLFIGLSVLQLAQCNSKYAGIVIQSVDRTIDLTTQLARHTTKITFLNESKPPASNFFLWIEEKMASKLSFIQVIAEPSGAVLAVTPEQTPVKAAGLSFQEYRVNLGSSSNTNSTTIVVRYTFANVMVPHPASIHQGERQLVKYTDPAGHAFPSPYPIKTVTTVVKTTATPQFTSQYEKFPSQVKGNTITLGPYHDLAPLRPSFNEERSQQPMIIHFENNSPFITFTEVRREIEVSHWGNVAVEEHYRCEHRGAKLKGVFSRYDYQINPNMGLSSVRLLEMWLPRDIVYTPGSEYDVWYRDEIGNISTSYLPAAPQEKGYLLQLEPRYPLFGGWKTEFTVGYNLPAENYILRDADDRSHYVLNISFIPNWKTDVVIEKLQIKVILPEGAKDITLHVPYSLDKEGRGVHYTYLDTVGRPVVFLEKSNLVNEHYKFFQVSYTFAATALLREPLLVIGAITALSVAIIFFSRLEISIIPKSKSMSSNNARIAELLKKYKEIRDQRKRDYNDLMTALERYLRTAKSSADATWESEYQRISTRIKAKDQPVVQILHSLEEIAEGIATKISYIEEKQQTQWQQLQEIIRTKIQQKKDKTLSSGTKETVFEKQYAKLEQEIDDLVSELTQNS